MPTVPKKASIYESEEGKVIRQALIDMQSDSKYKTVDGYNANGEEFPDHVISFVEKHMLYLSKHKDVDPQHYLSNLRLKIKIRS